MFKKLSPGNIAVMLEQPEVGMDIQVGLVDGGYVLVAGGRVTATIDDGIVEQLARLTDILGHHESESRTYIQEWTDSLPQSPFVNPVSREEALAALGFIHLGPLRPLGPPPSRPAFIYGHLPFHGICSGREVFYRYEHYPTSFRIDTGTGEIKGDTYAAPELELDYVKSGLGAVARYALPSLLPARWRYELRPIRGTLMRYGACVPLYGQAGGGVEVMFPRAFNNSVTVPNPQVLPIF